jgi:starch synthase
MKILMVASEIAPFVKVGGLADVVGALPKYLARDGHKVRLVCPLYGGIEKRADWIPYNIPLSVPLAGIPQQCRIWEARLPGAEVEVYFIEYNEFFVRPEIYSGPWGEHQDNDQRFYFLSRAALNLCYYLGWIPDVIHCHDWMTALIPILLNTTDRDEPLGGTATVLTIHNLQHQGIFGTDVVKVAELPRDIVRPDGFGDGAGVNFLKGGIFHATKISTVSPSYAREIQTEDHGCGLHAALKFRGADLIGVLNGIDADVWNPANDRFLPATYDRRRLATGKPLCKRALQKTFSLPESAEVPLFGVVSRLYEQKGLDLLDGILPKVMAEMDVQFVILGSGDKQLENQFSKFAAEFPDRVGVRIGFDDRLAHMIFAGSDFFVMPSRFEPCGLSQMYAMAYGTPPIVRATGGLIDTVEPYVEGAGQGTGTGFVFQLPSPDGLYYALGWACSTWYDRPEEYRKLQHNGMGKDFSWQASTALYADVYHWAVEDRTGRPLD